MVWSLAGGMMGEEMGRILQCEGLTKAFTSGLIRTKCCEAVKNVTFDIDQGEIVSLVGESGSGKTTVSKLILRLIEPTSGRVLFDDKDVSSYERREYYRRVQAIVQDPYAAYNPFYKVDRVLEEIFGLYKNGFPPEKRKEIIASTLRRIGINPEEILGRYPHQLSGGQLQRFLIARPLIINSEIVVADEATSMLDASTRAGILNLLLSLKENEKISILFITHDIAQAQYISDRVLVMQKGEVVEQGLASKVFLHPTHPYTKELFSSVPQLREKWNFEKTTQGPADKCQENP
jgi:peptide/nickel transport system ATP-binding protein